MKTDDIEALDHRRVTNEDRINFGNQILFDLPSKPKDESLEQPKAGPAMTSYVKVQNAAQLEGEENCGSPELPRLAARRKATECIMLSAFGAQNGVPAYEVAIVNFADTSSSGTCRSKLVTRSNAYQLLSRGDHSHV